MFRNTAEFMIGFLNYRAEFMIGFLNYRAEFLNRFTLFNDIIQIANPKGENSNEFTVKV